MTAVHSKPLSGTDPGAIRAGLVALLDPDHAVFEADSRVLVVPDVHYPYHPSTGLVTNPDVVGELVDLLDFDVAIGIPASEYIGADRAARYLGYERVAERTGAPIVDLDAADSVERRARFVGKSVSLEVPRPLLDDTVVVVPTLRRSSRLGVAAGMVTLARAVTHEPTREEVQATIRTCWPALSVLDATFAYAGEPRRTELLATSDDVVALSRSSADLLDVDLSDVPHLTQRRTPSPSPSLRSLVGPSTDGRPSEGDGVMAKGYRFYARMTGDLVPPQMLPRGDHE